MMRHAAYALAVAFAACCLAIALSGCQALMPALQLLAENAQCALANQDLPNEEILKRCAVRPENFQRVLDMVGTAREQSALQANRAAAVQAEKDQRSGLCK